MNVILNLVKRLLEYSESEQQSDQNHHCDQTNAQHARLRSETHLDFFFPFYLFNFFFFGTTIADCCFPMDLEICELGSRSIL